MVRGQEAKTYITEKLMSVFPGTFINDKEIRIPYKESNGEIVQVKVALTAAKTNVSMPTEVFAENDTSTNAATASETPNENVVMILSRLIKELN